MEMSVQGLKVLTFKSYKVKFATLQNVPKGKYAFVDNHFSPKIKQFEIIKKMKRIFYESSFYAKLRCKGERKGENFRQKCQKNSCNKVKLIRDPLKKKTFFRVWGEDR